MKKQTFLVTFLFMLTISTGHGQINYFFEVNGNYSIIPTYGITLKPQISVPMMSGSSFSYWPNRAIESYDSKPGFDFKLGAQKYVFYKSNLETGVSFSILNFKRNYYIDTSEHGDTSNDEIPTPLLGFNTMGATRIGSITIPLNLNYALIENRLVLQAGISTSFLIFSRHYYSQYEINTTIDTNFTGNSIVDVPNPVPTPREYDIKLVEYIDKSAESFNRITWNGSFSIQYRVFQKVWLNTTYLQSFSRVYDQKNDSESKAKARLVKIGLRYYLKSYSKGHVIDVSSLSKKKRGLLV